jgi:hypothetical protein
MVLRSEAGIPQVVFQQGWALAFPELFFEQALGLALRMRECVD